MRLIEAEPDPVIRNAMITSAYDDLSRETSGLLGDVDANWLTFGKWASFTAGRFIRGEGAPVRWGAGKVAEGNVAIITDIAPQFVRFLELADAGSNDDLADLVASDDVLGSNPTTLEIPEGSLDLSDPVPLPRYLLGEQWPRALSEISDARLNALVRSYGHEWTAMDGSAATTWEVFDERMGYIAQFFRAYQRDPSLRMHVVAPA